MIGHNALFIAIDTNCNFSDCEDKQSFRVIDNNGPKAFSDLTAILDTLIDYSIDNMIPLNHIKIMRVTKISDDTYKSMILSKIIEWAEELRENIQGNKKCLEQIFLNFDIGTPVAGVIEWIKDITGYDLSFYFRHVLK